MAEEAHRLGMGVTGHVPAFTNADEAIKGGFDEITHINQLMFGWELAPHEDTRTTLRLTGLNRLARVDLESDRVQNTLTLMRENGTALDTTVAIQERLALSRAGKSQPGDWPFLEHIPVDYKRFRLRNFVDTSEPGRDEEYHAAIQRMLQVIKLLHEQGTQLLAGTDDGYGFVLHRELELYVKAGIPAGEALQLATLKAARYMSQDQLLGSIERGKLADLVLLPADPTKDISMIRRARMVMRGGTMYFPADIHEALSIKPFSTKPTATEY